MLGPIFRKLSPFFWIFLGYLAIFIFLGIYVNKNFQKWRGDAARLRSALVEEFNKLPHPTQIVSSEPIKEAIKPKHAPSKQAEKKKIETPQGTVTAVSEGPIDQEAEQKIREYAAAGPVTNINYNDRTGRYSNLGDILKNYLNNQLLWGPSDIAYLYEIRISDCSPCAASGYYYGNYITSAGKITKAFGWIEIFALEEYKDPAVFPTFAKTVFAHEYGHHYTLYHKYLDFNLPYGQRFPDSYYSVRPLSNTTTAPDYSKGWINSDAEIIAEDYNYFYSGFGQHAMRDVYGLPSAETNIWLRELTGSPSVAEDNQPPAVSITAPADKTTVSGLVVVTIQASDNVRITRAEFYIDNQLLLTDSESPYRADWNTNTNSNGSHTIKAKVFDAYQNSQSEISVTVENSAGETEKPVVTIVQPPNTPYSWTEGNLTIEATSTDNIGIVKIELYTNDYLVAQQSNPRLFGYCQFEQWPNGTYQFEVRAYDAAGNIGKADFTVTK